MVETIILLIFRNRDYDLCPKISKIIRGSSFSYTSFIEMKVIEIYCKVDATTKLTKYHIIHP